MRSIVSAGERVSSHWLVLTRPGATERPYSAQRLLIPSLTRRDRHVSSLSSSNPRQWGGSHPRRRREVCRRDSFQEFNTTSKRPAIEAIETPTQGFDKMVPPTWDSPEEERKYIERFFQVLEDGQPDQVMGALIDPRSAGLVGSLPRNVFIEALHKLSPAHFVEPFRELHHPLHSWSVLKNGLKRIEEIFDEFVQNLITITRYRRAGGEPLELDEYRHLLDCARSMGNGPLANHLWDAMERDEIAPDALCYNHYMEAKVWDHCYTGQEQYRVRVLPFQYRKRRMEDRNVGWQGFGTAGQSVRKEVMNLFRRMTEEGHPGDERAYINVMLASARVGHNPGLRHVLKTVWNIDVEALKEQPDDSKLPPPTPYEPWSALHPTEDLLFAVAHALGTNNDIAGAVRTVQFISTSYHIFIPAKVWHELFERAYVLCRLRNTNTRREQQATEIGKTSMGVVRSLFDTMTSAPYSIKPTFQILRFMMNLCIDFGSLEDCKAHLDEAYQTLQEARAKQDEARSVVLRCLMPILHASRQTTSPDPSLYQCPQLAEAIRAYDLVRLQVYQQTYLLQRILWVIIRVPHWHDTPDKAWLYQERPKMQEEWWDFIPARKRLFYDENEMWMAGHSGFRDRHWGSSKHIPVRRRTDGRKLFEPTEGLAWTEKGKWFDLSNRYPHLDTSTAPVNRLFAFEQPNSPEFEEALKKLRNNWVEYPEDHPQSTKDNPHGGFYGRLAALGMLKPKERGIFLLDDASWT